MSSLTKGHTPPIIIREKNGVDFSEFDHVYVTFKQGALHQLTKSDNDLTIDGSTITVQLTQAETLGFCEGEKIKVQVDVTFDNGKRSGNQIPAEIDVNQILLRRVVE